MPIVDRTPVPAGPQVLLVSTYFPPHLGGVEVVAQNQARSLARAGYRVTVATTRDHPERPRRETVDGYQVIRLPARNLLERRTGIPYPILGPAFCGTLYGLVRRSDVVHVHDVLYQPPQLAALFAHLAAKPLVVSQNTGSVHHDARLVRAVEGVSVATAGRYIWSRARRVTAHNQLVYDHLTARGVPAQRIVRVGNGIDTGVFSPAAAAGPARLRSRLGSGRRSRASRSAPARSGRGRRPCPSRARWCRAARPDRPASRGPCAAPDPPAPRTTGTIR
jgi:glycosyltransferase involved in cell wall biosynthesis